MNTDVLKKSATLEELIWFGKERLEQARADLEQERKAVEWAEQQAKEATLALVREKLPEAIWPYLAHGGFARSGAGHVVEINLPECDTIWSTWRIHGEMGPVSLSKRYSLGQYVPGLDFPENINKREFDCLEDALAAAVEQGPTYARAEAAIAERVGKTNSKASEPTTLRGRLQIALEKGDDQGWGTDPQWRLTAVIAEALVSIAESQIFISNQSNGY